LFGCNEPDTTATGDLELKEIIAAKQGKTDSLDGIDDLWLCSYVCEVTREEVGCFNQQACSDFCTAEATEMDPSAFVAYATCAAENPLCYQFMESCMWHHLYPDPMPIDVHVKGEGFGAHEGLPIIARVDAAVGTAAEAQATVQDGAFELSWQINEVIDFHLILYYVDIDGDGSCTPGIDFTGSDFVPIGGPWPAPRFEAVISPAPSNGWQCQYINP